MTAPERDAKDELFWDLAGELMADPAVTRGTMMGFPCLRLNGTFFASVEPKTGDLIVKLPEPRVGELIQAGTGAVFAPNHRVFREWVAIERYDRAVWGSLLREAQAFASHD